ncbi:MAG: RNB domain-containing ribonuclease, partial [Clostridia bacterium]
MSKPFSLESIEQARAAAHSSIESQSARRVDLRGKTVFTLGDKPFTRRGVAFSVQKDGSNFVVGIHVCDVAEYVAPNTALDNDAKLRAKSLYNNSDKYNMLPFELLSGICSIVMNEPRIAVSAFVTFDADANVVACKFCESVISSVLDGTFSDIDVLLQSSDDSAIMSLRERYGVISDQIFDMYSLAALLKSKRISSGGVDYDHTQTVFNLSNDAVPISMECVADTDSNLMLKEICIAAGDVAGKTLGSANFECVYMGVDEPLYDSCKDAPTAILPISENFDISKHGYIRAAIDKARIDGNEKLIYNCITASLDSPCYYNRAASNLICSTDTFCNFFAPDASYSSLLAQRCIKSFINNERILVEQSVNTASINESLVFNAERELKQCLELIYMKTQIGVKFRGTVLAFSSEGTLVMLDCGAIGYILNGTCKRSFYLGDNVNVFVSDVSLQSKSII